MDLEFQLTLFPTRGTDYAHRITACPPEFENLTASLCGYATVHTGRTWMNSFDLILKVFVSNSILFPKDVRAGRAQFEEWAIAQTFFGGLHTRSLLL